MNICELRLNQNARIVSIEMFNKKIRNHFLEMGLVKNTPIKIIKIAPMEDPISIEIRGYELCLRKEDAKKIKVEVYR